MLRITRRIVKRSGDLATAFRLRFGMTPREYPKRRLRVPFRIHAGDRFADEVRPGTACGRRLTAARH